MSKLLHAVLHGLALLVQYANVASGVVPVKYQPAIAASAALAQAILAMTQHKVTPDVQAEASKQVEN